MRHVTYPPSAQAPIIDRCARNGSLDFVDILEVVCEASKHGHKGRTGRAKVLTSL
ncbi:hypothetical protein LPU83_pLPU83d_1651 (plasmid) [Rhizobium favelukesii]|uniref:Uncharacterized protein n=1 Tax=Rhizobium favelukesii TaxID=348824 RepID=W6SA62_9HYPH|nr:hypothetical protein LPU83_pLPU83d_1651 [Rhizobium favelukesii]